MVVDEGGAPGASLDEVKAWLRVAGTGEDALLAAMVGAATGLCEHFLGQWLIVREAREAVAASGEWRRLEARPVVAIEAVAGVDADGDAVALPVGAYAIDIDGDGTGWVRLATGVPGVARLDVTYRAGMATDVEGVPAAIRQGIVRMAAEAFMARDGRGGAVPPAVVTALWRPWRRMRVA